MDYGTVPGTKVEICKKRREEEKVDIGLNQNPRNKSGKGNRHFYKDVFSNTK